MDRRSFLGRGSTAVAGVVSGLSLPAFAVSAAAKFHTEEVPPVEDLMREHGALNRILLIYEEASRRLRSGGDLDSDQLKRAANLIHDFIENYHEQLEEEHLFPRLAKGPLGPMIEILRMQHQAGRNLTSGILGLATATHIKNTNDRNNLASFVDQFVRMYRPHEAREDTVVFLEFKKTVTPREYGHIGEIFEDRERQQFGKDGFEAIVAKIAEIEKTLGIYDLTAFTPVA
ncbi:MAG TPA: hemerythrin domain-containing protein [Bdellovibrionota bacterium]|jgi:hemerythrin-like domain-containing protein|nr:hemerythrin domain-containing protein [Bdellovibrionota bacterium]